MGDKFDSKKFAARLEAMPPAERGEIWRRFWIWIQAGAKAQRGLGALGIGIAGIGVVVALVWIIGPYPPPGPEILFCIIPVIVGCFVFRAGAQREAEWRARNPFEF
jgi:hypothetical protein